MSDVVPVPSQLNLVVRDLSATLAFYRLLGWPVGEPTGLHAVDALWSRMTAAGHPSRQRPYDTFWGSRFAVVADPDGHQIGLMSPSSDAHRFWPPAPAPS